MGMFRPLAFEVAWAQPRIGVRNPEAARPAIVLPKKDLLFIRSVMLVLILNPAGLALWVIQLWWDVGRAGVGRQRVSPLNDARVRGELIAVGGELLIHAFEAFPVLA